MQGIFFLWLRKMRIARKCTYCGSLGHNARTCQNSFNIIGDYTSGVKLFGVQLHLHSNSSSTSSSSPSTNFSVKRSFSMDYMPSNSRSSSLPLPSAIKNSDKMYDTHLPSASGHKSSIQNRKKGVAWTKEEHQIFLKGVEKLGKGNWRDISKNFITTRTPQQVASHEQKYFLAQNSFNRRRKQHHSLLHVGDESVNTFNSNCTNLLSKWTTSHLDAVLNWSKVSSTSINYTHQIAAPDLELKLATPMPLELTESCSASIFS